jgi:hypothetical protein
MLMYPDARRRKVSRWQRFFVETLYTHLGTGATKLIEVFSKFRVSASTSFLEGSLRKKKMAAADNN